MGTLANSEDTDEMLHKSALFARNFDIQRKIYIIFGKYNL